MWIDNHEYEYPNPTRIPSYLEDYANEAVSKPVRIAGITTHSLNDGPGIRTVYFVPGCPYGCEGCHNLELTNPAHPVKIMSAKDAIVKYVDDSTTGITLSGGDPLWNAAMVLPLALAAKFVGLHVVLYTGSTLEYLKGYTDQDSIALLDVVDSIKVGQYKCELKDGSLPYVGSTNQMWLNKVNVAGAIGHANMYSTVECLKLVDGSWKSSEICSGLWNYNKEYIVTK